MMKKEDALNFGDKWGAWESRTEKREWCIYILIKNRKLEYQEVLQKSVCSSYLERVMTHV